MRPRPSRRGFLFSMLCHAKREGDAASVVAEAVIFIKAMLVGLGIAVPVGPVGVLCVRRTLVGGPLLGFSSGLGAALADTIYGALAAFGLAAVGAWMLQHGDWFRIGGGLFLIVMGAANLVNGPREARQDSDNGSLFWAFTSTFGLTLTNPLTLIALTAIFAALGLAESVGTTLNALILVAGVFAGACLWWLGLSAAVLLLRERVTLAWMKRIHYASALLVLGFGIYALADHFFAGPLTESGVAFG